MKWFRHLNPTRAIMGRLFFWFWATFIVTAVLAVWSTRLFFEDLEVNAASPRQLTVLTRGLEKLNSERGERGPLRMALQRSVPPFRGRMVAVDLETQQVITAGGPPMREKEERDIVNLLEQTSPISITRGALKVTGPVFFNRDDNRYALFVMNMEMPTKSTPPFVLLLCIAIGTTSLLSWLFARSLTRPILQIQTSARSLANGKWKTRVNNAEKRQDELGQLGRDFNRMATQLDAMWTGQKRLLADISHELRSPLARLQMALGLAHQQNVDPTTLVRIEREAERMDALIGQLLVLSKAEAGVTTFSSHTLSALFHDVFTDGQFEAANKNRVLDIADIPKLTVQAEHTMLCRAVENVLRNAIRHSEHAIEVAFDVSEDYWSVIIADDGPGLSAQECERVFSPFYRASLARERESGGVGLGLSIAKAAVELHHGNISAKRGQNNGLVVTLSFPRSLNNA